MFPKNFLDKPISARYFASRKRNKIDRKRLPAADEVLLEWSGAAGRAGDISKGIIADPKSGGR
jgi:hypothetical protein